jgi:hypothetical protein
LCGDLLPQDFEDLICGRRRVCFSAGTGARSSVCFLPLRPGEATAVHI